MRTTFSDEQIINGIKSSNNLVLGYLYSEYGNIILRYVILNSGTKYDAEEVLQDSIIKVVFTIKKKGFILKRSFDAYFTSIYQNTWKCVAKCFNKIEITNDCFLDNIAEIETDLYDKYILEQLTKLTWSKYENLDSNCRDILNMFYYQKKTMIEITYRMDYKNEQVAKNKRYKCVEYLKKLIKNHPTYKNLIYE